MKNKRLAAVLGVVMGMTMAVTSVPVLAEQEATAAEATAETEAQETQEETAEDFAITAGDQSIDVKNETAITVKEAAYAAEEGKETGILSVTEEGGTVHTFENVTMGEWKEVTFVEEYGFVYVKYQDGNGQNMELVETADEKELEEPVTVYAVDNANVRSEAKTDSSASYVTTVGEKATVTAVVPGWLKIQIGGKEGYSYHSFFTEDKEKADAELSKRREAQAAAQAAQASAQSYDDYQGGGQSSYQGVYEVSRQAYDDCDGSGHGYYEITYSDGSVAIQEY